MNQLTDEDLATMAEGAKYGIDMLQSMPRGSRAELEAHLTGVLMAFWAALWGTMGSDYARGFIEAQLRSMDPNVPCEHFKPPSTH